MTQAAIEAGDFRNLLFGSAGRGLLFQLSRLQEIFDDFSDRMLRKPWIDLDTDQSRILMSLAMQPGLRMTGLQQRAGIGWDALPELLSGLLNRGLIVYPEGDTGDPQLQLSAKGAATIERMQRLLRKADELVTRELQEARSSSLQVSMARFADQLLIGQN